MRKQSGTVPGKCTDVLACATYAHILYELSCMTGDDRLQDLAAAYGRAQTVLAVR